MEGKNISFEKHYYRASEVAELLSIAQSTVWMYRKQGKLKATKISPRVTVFNIDEINNLMNC